MNIFYLIIKQMSLNQLLDIIATNDIHLFNNYIKENDVNYDIGGYGRNILFYVIKNNNINQLKILLDNNIDLYHNINGTALHQAVNQHRSIDNTNIIEMLLKYINVDVVDELKWTPLQCAVANNDKSCVDLLLLNGANINKIESRGYTALHIAIAQNNYEMIRLLCERGANIHIQNYMNYSPYDLLMKTDVRYLNPDRLMEFNEVKKLLAE